jgi:hypothetical protein
MIAFDSVVLIVIAIVLFAAVVSSFGLEFCSGSPRGAGRPNTKSPDM